MSHSPSESEGRVDPNITISTLLPCLPPPGLHNSGACPGQGEAPGQGAASSSSQRLRRHRPRLQKNLKEKVVPKSQGEGTESVEGGVENTGLIIEKNKASSHLQP